MYALATSLALEGECSLALPAPLLKLGSDEIKIPNRFYRRNLALANLMRANDVITHSSNMLLSNGIQV